MSDDDQSIDEFPDRFVEDDDGEIVPAPAGELIIDDEADGPDDGSAA